MSDELRDFGNGATRSKDADEERYDLISPFAMRRVAQIMAQGAEVHGPSNWRLGIPIDATLNHLERHLQLWKMEKWTGEKIGVDDHIAKVIWGAMAVAHYEEAGPADFGTMIPTEDLKNHPDVTNKKVEFVPPPKQSQMSGGDIKTWGEKPRSDFSAYYKDNGFKLKTAESSVGSENVRSPNRPPDP